MSICPEFDPVTLGRIKKFQEGIDELQKRGVSLATAREYLLSRESDVLSQEDKDLIDELERVRKKSIHFVMEMARREAADDGIEIPSRYLTGDTLEVVFAPETYRYEEFDIFSWFSWYTLTEKADIAMNSKLFRL